MKPNLVLIMTDQQRADFTRGAGFPLDTMPFVDGLADRGARFANAYTTIPACAPARCSLLTGRFPKAHRVRENQGTANVVRTDDLLDVLRAQGYALFLAGKNHTYRAASDFDQAASYSHFGGNARSAEEAAFDQWLTQLDYEPQNCKTSVVPTPFPFECQLPHRIVRDALEMVDQRDTDKPFFLWLSFPEPHNPYQAPEPYFSLFSPEQMPARGRTGSGAG